MKGRRGAALEGEALSETRDLDVARLKQLETGAQRPFEGKHAELPARTEKKRKRFKEFYKALQSFDFV